MKKDSYITYWLMFLIFVLISARYIARNEPYVPVQCTAGSNGGMLKQNDTEPIPRIDGQPTWSSGGMYAEPNQRMNGQPTWSSGDERLCSTCPRKGFQPIGIPGV